MATTPHSSWNLSVLSIGTQQSFSQTPLGGLFPRPMRYFSVNSPDLRSVTQPSKSTMTSIRASDLCFSPECGLQGFLVSPVQLGNRRRHYYPAIQTVFQFVRNCLA